MLRTTRPFELKFASDVKPGSFSGYGAVFDNIDDGGDMIAKGAFAEPRGDRSADDGMTAAPKTLCFIGVLEF